jgi:hypothetical protein
MEIFKAFVVAINCFKVITSTGFRLTQIPVIIIKVCSMACCIN